MAKFNALGSNFTLGQAWKVLWMSGKENIEDKVKEQLRDFWGEQELQVEFFYKGREALRAGLASLNLPGGSKIGVVGFTCLAVIEAIEREGLVVELLEIDENLNIDIQILPNNLKALIIQNTFGFPQRQIEQLINYCRQNKIILIEDGAHGFGARYENGSLVGTLGEIAFFSGSQDKVWDGVAGGILVGKTPLMRYEKKTVNRRQQVKDRCYPLLTWIIRHTYEIGVGKIVHAVARKFHWLSQPMNYDGEGELHQLPNWQIELLGGQLERMADNLAKRRKNLVTYLQNLEERFLLPGQKKIPGENSACLRLPIVVAEEKRTEILRALKQAGYYLTDFWYDAPVGTRKSLDKYPNRQGIEAQFAKIPKAVKKCEQILNLPLHQEMTTRDIKRICEIVQS